MWCWQHFYLLAILQITSVKLAVTNVNKNEITEEFDNTSPLVDTYKASRRIKEIIKSPITANNIAHNKINNINMPNGYMNGNIPNTYFSRDNKIRDLNVNNKQIISPYNVIGFTRQNAESVPNYQRKADIFAVLDSSTNADIELPSKDGISVYKWKPKTISLNIGDPFAKSDNSKFYLQILVDNVDIQGTVSVSGSLPLYGTVALNGNVPSTGKALVNYGKTPSKKSF